jgi:hypothetical protein
MLEGYEIASTNRAASNERRKAGCPTDSDGHTAAM